MILPTVDVCGAYWDRMAKQIREAPPETEEVNKRRFVFFHCGWMTAMVQAAPRN